jgi:lipopolysaccharide export system protein LptA
MRLSPLIALAALPLLIGTSAQAQLAKSMSSGGPLDISSSTTAYDPDNCMSVWKGQVEVTQDQSRLRADEVNTISKRTGKNACGGDIDRIEATGNVFYVTPDLKARGDKAIYLVANDTVTITGKVVVSSESGVSETNRLVINVNTGEAKMGDAGSGQRVRAVLYPNAKKTAPQKP